MRKPALSVCVCVYTTLFLAASRVGAENAPLVGAGGRLSHPNEGTDDAISPLRFSCVQRLLLLRFFGSVFLASACASFLRLPFLRSFISFHSSLSSEIFVRACASKVI